MPGHNNWYNINLNPFKITFSPKPFKKLSLSDAASLTVNRMVDINPNIWLAMSGGMDSEFAANAFYENNVKFTPIIWKYHLNTEADYAIHWCRSRNITPYIVDKNINDDKIKQLLKNIASRYGSQTWFGAVNAYLAEIVKKHGGSLVTGTGVITTDYPYPSPIGTQAEFCVYEFFVDLLTNHHGSFMIYSQELFYALLSEIDENDNTQEFKSRMYNVPFRPKLRPYHLFVNETQDHSSTDINLDYSYTQLKELMTKFIV